MVAEVALWVFVAKCYWVLCVNTTGTWIWGMLLKMQFLTLFNTSFTVRNTSYLNTVFILQRNGWMVRHFKSLFFTAIARNHFIKIDLTVTWTSLSVQVCQVWDPESPANLMFQVECRWSQNYQILQNTPDNCVFRWSKFLRNWPGRFCSYHDI